MLSKLFKYEFQATARFFGLAYAALLVMSVLAGVSIRFSNGNQEMSSAILAIITFAIYGALVGVIMVATLVQIINRFYKNLLKGEGYLMNTLPVHTWQLITSKLLVTLVLGICSLIVGCLSAGILFAGAVGFEVIGQGFSELMKMFPQLFEEFTAQNGIGVVGYFCLAALDVLLSFAAAILMVYAAIAVGQLVNNHRALVSVGAFIGFSIVQSAVESVILSRVAYGSLSFSGTFEGTAAVVAVSYHPTAGILLSMLLTVSFGVIFFVIAEELLRRKLNLQ